MRNRNYLRLGCPLCRTDVSLVGQDVTMKDTASAPNVSSRGSFDRRARQVIHEQRRGEYGSFVPNSVSRKSEVRVLPPTFGGPLVLRLPFGSAPFVPMAVFHARKCRKSSGPRVAGPSFKAGALAIRPALQY
jgi:hypothetical protein